MSQQKGGVTGEAAEERRIRLRAEREAAFAEQHAARRVPEYIETLKALAERGEIVTLHTHGGSLRGRIDRVTEGQLVLERKGPIARLLRKKVAYVRLACISWIE